ncbi:hypothetical protein QAD02_008905 [Eretmocerus hayati]|uniref:Uncharacterized protein n=1 Tax=Eretmocerus hayati TaxID=131215 RepID=A0ACC2N8J3_9HYME|nr:hypothetical protein QAD02_008905 [Eretmocerus hayati]
MARPRPQDRQARTRPRKDKMEHNSFLQNVCSWSGVVMILAVGVASYYCYKGYNETRVNTPFSTDKLVDLSHLNKKEYYWGSYRSHAYFGMKTREPYSLVTGLMWYFPPMLQGDGRGLRHWCTQDDRLEKYGWLKHDGKNFGIQEIQDNGVKLTTSFVKKTQGLAGGEWTAKIKVTPVIANPWNKKISLLYYAAIEDKTNGDIHPVIDQLSESLGSIEGMTRELGYFSIHFNVTSTSRVDQSYLVTRAPSLVNLKETVLQNFRIITVRKGQTDEERIVLPSQPARYNNGEMVPANFIVTQVTAKLPFEFEVRFDRNSASGQKDLLSGASYDEALKKLENSFDTKFENIFKLKGKGYKADEISFAKAAFSNMIGSIGYFYGSAQVQSEYNQSPVPYWKAPLFSAVPSRSFFPRGFLWDEGFHGLLLSNWDLDLEIDIISHWYDLMNIQGWIPREMILGDEAIQRVPAEFINQFNTNANPPTFFLTLQFLLKHRQDELLSKHMNLLEKLYPRLEAWYEWFNSTQLGEIPSTYRWRGRKESSTSELNPKTLTSGLDDYPRASHPDKNERHIDLRCWMALASKVMASLADILYKRSSKYKSTFEYLSNNELMNKLHWSPRTNTYADYGLHTDKVKLQKPSASRQNRVSQDKIRVVLDEPQYRFVDTTFGYVSLFPFILCLLDPESPQLEKVLKDLQNPDYLWTDYGLRSLAKESPLYMKYNTEHDPPYWRGAIWMNLNYLSMSALHHYSNVEGPNQEQAKIIYEKLRKNLIKNVISQYKKSGYLWENYADDIGTGKGSHPFTGWTALTVLLMAEIY